MANKLEEWIESVLPKGQWIAPDQVVRFKQISNQLGLGDVDYVVWLIEKQQVVLIEAKLWDDPSNPKHEGKSIADKPQQLELLKKLYNALLLRLNHHAQTQMWHTIKSTPQVSSDTKFDTEIMFVIKVQRSELILLEPTFHESTWFQSQKEMILDLLCQNEQILSRPQIYFLTPKVASEHFPHLFTEDVPADLMDEDPTL